MATVGVKWLESWWGGSFCPCCECVVSYRVRQKTVFNSIWWTCSPTRPAMKLLLRCGLYISVTPVAFVKVNSSYCCHSHTSSGSS